MKGNLSGNQDANLEAQFSNLSIGQVPQEDIKEKQSSLQQPTSTNEYYYNYSQVPYSFYPSTVDSVYENQNYYYPYQMMYPQMQNYTYYYNANPQT